VAADAVEVTATAWDAEALLVGRLVEAGAGMADVEVAAIVLIAAGFIGGDIGGVPARRVTDMVAAVKLTGAAGGVPESADVPTWGVAGALRDPPGSVVRGTGSGNANACEVAAKSGGGPATVQLPGVRVAAPGGGTMASRAAVLPRMSTRGAPARALPPAPCRLLRLLWSSATLWGMLLALLLLLLVLLVALLVLVTLLCLLTLDSLTSAGRGRWCGAVEWLWLPLPLAPPVLAVLPTPEVEARLGCMAEESKGKRTGRGEWGPCFCT